MEKKIGENVSSGAEKVEKTEKKTRKKNTEENKSAKKAVKKSAKKPVKKSAQEKAEKREKAAAEKRVLAAKKRAEKKEKKIQHRLELKAKKLEHKKELALKKEERKKKRLEKRAALKEKRVERRAERIARRELLKNESRSDKQKRLARQKREKIAVKRKRAEAKEKARSERMQAREAARARKAESRKHKREQNTERKKNKRAPGFGGWLAAVISLGAACLALATVVTAGAMRMNEMTLSSENGARSTLYEIVSYSEDMDNNLTKLRVATGEDEKRRLLTDILIDSELMENALERIPVDAATSTDISAFVNKTGAYARTLLQKVANGNELTEKEKNTVSYLWEVNTALRTELNDLLVNMTDKDFRAFMSGKTGELSNRFGEMGQTSKRQPETDVDALFSGEQNVGENQLKKLTEVSESKAEELLKGYLESYHVRTVRYTGETVNGEIGCYNFVATDENDIEIFAQVSKNGGKLVFFDTYEVCQEKNFDLQTCSELAEKFLAGLGITDVEAVWLSDGGMVADITFVGSANGVRAYTDAVRVRVCESKGRVVGISAMGYFANHTERSVSAGITEAEARESLGGLQAEEGRLALLPVNGEEKLAYEFYCTDGETEYVAYIDAETGDEIELYCVRNGSRGRYLK